MPAAAAAATTLTIRILPLSVVQSIWDDNVWVYSTTFTLPDDKLEYLLVFDGIKMGARISLNGHALGEVYNQFRRYEYSLNASVLAGSTQTSVTGAEVHHLQVTFDKAVVMEGNRFMACTGGWDWAPYTTTCSTPANQSRHGPDNPPPNSYGAAQTFSKGIWKSVYVLGAQDNAAVIKHVVPQVP